MNSNLSNPQQETYIRYVQRIVEAEGLRITDSPLEIAIQAKISKEAAVILAEGRNLPKGITSYVQAEIERATGRRNIKDTDDFRDSVSYNKKINSVKNQLPEDATLMQSVLSGVVESISSATPLEIITRDEELGSISTLFIFWVLQQSGKFTPADASVIFRYIYKKQSFKKIDAVLSIKDSKERYTEIKNFFDNATIELVREFALTANLNDEFSAGSAVKEIVKSNNEFIAEADALPPNMYFAQTNSIERSSRPREMDYMGILVVRIQNGDLTARNELCILLMPEIQKKVMQHIKGKSYKTLTEDLVAICLTEIFDFCPTLNPLIFNKQIFKHISTRLSFRLKRECLKENVIIHTATQQEIIDSVLRLRRDELTNDEIIDRLKDKGYEEETIQHAIVPTRITSLEAPIRRDETEITFGSTLATPELSPDYFGILKDDLNQLPDWLFTRKLLELRYIDGLIFREIGDVFGVSFERIRQLLDQFSSFVLDPIHNKYNSESVELVDPVKAKCHLSATYRTEDLLEAAYLILGIHKESFSKEIKLPGVFSNHRLNKITDSHSKSPRPAITDFSPKGQTPNSTKKSRATNRKTPFATALWYEVQKSRQELLEMNVIRIHRDADFLRKLSIVKASEGRVYKAAKRDLADI